MSHNERKRISSSFTTFAWNSGHFEHLTFPKIQLKLMSSFAWIREALDLAITICQWQFYLIDQKSKRCSNLAKRILGSGDYFSSCCSFRRRLLLPYLCDQMVQKKEVAAQLEIFIGFSKSSGVKWRSGEILGKWQSNQKRTIV